MPITPRETRYARSGDVNIAYQIVGNGPVDLVLGLGWISHLDYFWEEPRCARFVERLAGFARVILFDKRGTGLSDPVPPDDLPTVEQRIDDLRAVMDAAGSERAVLLGMSESAALSALFAATYPDRTAGLILFGGYARRTWAPDYPWAPTAAERQALYDRIEHGWGDGADLATVAPSLADDTVFCAWWSAYQRRGASPASALALARMDSAIDIRHVLPSIDAPALILHRQGDQTVSIANGRYLADRIAGATLVELDGADHLPFLGDQEAVLGEIERFLTGTASRPAPDRVLATLLAVEIVDAPATATRLGDRRWGDAQAAFRAMVRQAVVRHRGQPVALTLDGVLASFDDPLEAVHCADGVIATARRLGLDARAGLHSGEVAVAGDEIAGVALFLASRVASEARGGEVIASSTVKDLSAGAGIAFEPAGDRIFAGLPGEWELYRLVRETDESSGSPVRPVAPPHDSARPATVLSRREREIASLLALGLSNRQIAGELIISVATVERHIANILAKLGYRSRTQVAAWAVERGLLLHSAD